MMNERSLSFARAENSFRVRHLSATHPKPLAAELLDVGHDTEQRLRAPEHRLGFDVAEPDLQLRSEVVAGQLEHRGIAAAIQIQRVHYRNGRHR